MVCDELGIPHWQVPIERLSKLPLGFPLLAWRMRRIRPDLVVVHGQWAGVVGTLAARLAGVARRIYIAHWPSFYTDWDWYRVLRNHFTESISCQGATRIVTISEGNHYQFLIRRLGADGKFVTINNSMELRRVPDAKRIEEIRARHGWNRDRVHVVSVGRLADQKRLDWLLLSWRLVTARAPNARLWIVGEGPEHAALVKLAAKLGITGSCTFLGPQPNGIEYVAAADLVAMTTIYEGHANVPLEAMACGKALVTNAVDGVTDTVRDGVEGFLVPPGDIGLFAERLVQLIADPALRRTMAEGGIERVREFSPEKTMGKYRELIREVLAMPKTALPS
jgi:glycosyltransferase involved in cell wall biosynthesis